jgi:hypothetical protein
MKPALSRRRFLKAATGAAFVFQIVPRHVLGGDGNTPPSRKVNLAAIGAGGCRLIPETAMQAYKRPEPKIPRIRGGHQRDWLDAIRDGRQSGSPFEYGGRLSELGLLGVIAIRMTGKKLLYNERAMRFTNCPEANRLLNPPYRKGWKLA